MKAFLFYILVSLTFQAYSQNELQVINKENEKMGGRITKGSFLRIKTSDGKNYSGTLIKVNAYTIELARYSAVIDVEEIVTLKVQTEKGAFGLLPLAGFGVVYIFPKVRSFKASYWKFLVKEG